VLRTGIGLPGNLLILPLVGDGKLLPAFCSSARDHFGSVLGAHAFAKAVLVLALPLGWLECTFHDTVELGCKDKSITTKVEILTIH
jgi:hypothetical protein